MAQQVNANGVKVYESPPRQSAPSQTPGQNIPVVPVERQPDGSPAQPAPLPIDTSAPANPGVQVIEQRTAPAADLSSRRGAYTFTVDGGQWTDTGVTVAPGDHLAFTASGTAQLTDGRSTGPEGVARGWKDLLRTFALNSANAGALIGRIGSQAAAVPFPIGAQKEMDVAVTGHLWLAQNLSADLTSTGGYTVELTLAKTKEAGAPAFATASIGTLISPQLFREIPRRVQDEQGNPGDMVNFALIGTEAQVKSAFTAAGWVAVDKSTQDAILHGLLATLSHKGYTEMPMSTLTLFGRPQDLSYARADPLAVAAVRNHLRLWKTSETVDGKPLWVGAATHDNGFEKDQRTGGVTHRIDPKIDGERNYIEESFQNAGVVAGAAFVTPSNPLTRAKTATGGSFESDGRIVVMLLR